MAIGNAYAAGFNSTRKQQRSFMPAVNTLSSIIARRKKAQGSGRMARVGGRIQSGEDRADEFFAGIKAREDEQYERAMMDEQLRKQEEKDARSTSLMAAEEQRRQEAHEIQQAQAQQGMEQQSEVFDRKSKMADRSEAYEMVKQGLMMRDAKTVNAALASLVPQGEDTITEGEPVDGARSFRGRPGQVETPQFIFDPDSEVVGVLFPGQEKPTVFKNSKQAFQNVLAPMNPAHEQTKDQITAAKNKGELEFKSKKLTADVHEKGHQAAMKQFEFDGYYQPARFDKGKYEEAYREYVSRATGQDPASIQPPPEPSDEEKAAPELPEGIYTGDKPPKGFPGAKRGPNGGWYVKKGKGWAPIIGGKKGKKKAAPPKPKGEMQHAGFPKTVRKKVPAFGEYGGS